MTKNHLTPKSKNTYSSYADEANNTILMVATAQDCAAILDLQKVAYQTEAERYQD